MALEWLGAGGVAGVTSNAWKGGTSLTWQAPRSTPLPPQPFKLSRPGYAGFELHNQLNRIAGPTLR